MLVRFLEILVEIIGRERRTIERNKLDCVSSPIPTAMPLCRCHRSATLIYILLCIRYGIRAYKYLITTCLRSSLKLPSVRLVQA